MIQRIIYIITSVYCILFCSCKTDNNSMEIEKIVKEWTGKEIIFPQNISCISMNKDTTCVSPNSTPYKILVYTDSIGCMSCKLKLYKWNALIDEVKNEMQSLVNFQFYLHPKDVENVQFLLRRDAFKYPAYLDVTNQLDKINNLPKNEEFQTFLLDKNNIVVAIGNPVNNFRIWDLYKQIIKGNKHINLSDSQDTPLTSLQIEKQTIELKDLVVNKACFAKFNIKNIGYNPLIISNVNTTCGCTVPQWSKQPVLPNDTTTITVKVTPNNEGFFRKTITVNCNVKKQKIILIVNGIAKSQIHNQKGGKI